MPILTYIHSYIYDDCSISTDDCRLKFHVPHQIAPHVSSGGSESWQLIYKDNDRHDVQKSVLTGLIGSAWEILSLCTTKCLFSPDADLHTLLHITHTVLSGRCGTLDDDGLSVWDFIWFIYPAFERRACPHVSQIQFAWSHGKFSRFHFLSALFSFARSNHLTWREPQPVFTNSR